MIAPGNHGYANSLWAHRLCRLVAIIRAERKNEPGGEGMPSPYRWKKLSKCKKCNPL